MYMSTVVNIYVDGLIGALMNQHIRIQQNN